MSPRLLAPMLAMPAAPFDSQQYSFEVKWDGVRALAKVEAGGCGGGSRPITRHVTRNWRSCDSYQLAHYSTPNWWRSMPKVVPIYRVS
jgi:hypothetical protein